MRVKINFLIEKGLGIAINYNIFLCAIIYKFLNSANKAFAEFLHNFGFSFKESRNFKLFVFSDLLCKNISIRDNKIFFNDENILWYISSPIDNFIRYLVEGLFIENSEILIDMQYFRINKVEVLAEKNFGEKEKFKMLSPMVLSTKKEIDGKLKQYYFRYYDDFSLQLLQNLKRKYFLVYKKELECDYIKFEFDKDYINRQLQKKKEISRLRHIQHWNNKTNTYEDIMVKGILCPFIIETSPELIKIGYDCGFGEKNSIGFGMVESVNL